MSLITLLTDFGPADAYVAELRGVLLTAAPEATLVDMSHHVPPGDVAVASYLLGRAWHRFPTGTVHLVVVDPGVGTDRAALALASAGHHFVGPDNGVFSPVLGQADALVSLTVPEGAAPTFHGRDVFAPAAAALARGGALADLGGPGPAEPVRLQLPVPEYEGKSVLGTVVYQDRFGNLVTNLTPSEVPEYAVVEAEGVDVGPVRRTFGDVAVGALVPYWGSGGTLELAVRDGSAARRLGLGVGGRVRIRLG